MTKYTLLFKFMNQIINHKYANTYYNSMFDDIHIQMIFIESHQRSKHHLNII